MCMNELQYESGVYKWLEIRYMVYIFKHLYSIGGKSEGEGVCVCVCVCGGGQEERGEM